MAININLILYSYTKTVCLDSQRENQMHLDSIN